MYTVIHTYTIVYTRWPYSSNLNAEVFTLAQKQALDLLRWGKKQHSLKYDYTRLSQLMKILYLLTVLVLLSVKKEVEFGRLCKSWNTFNWEGYRLIFFITCLLTTFLNCTILIQSFSYPLFKYFFFCFEHIRDSIFFHTITSMHSKSSATKFFELS